VRSDLGDLGLTAHAQNDPKEALRVGALFDVMLPHYLRPFPACSIAQFSVDPAAGGQRPYVIARGTELVSRSINGVQCRFKTAYDVTLAPLSISEARYLPAAAAPVVLPVHAAGIVSITFESTSPQLNLRSLDLRSIRLQLNAESSFIAPLAEYFGFQEKFDFTDIDLGALIDSVALIRQTQEQDQIIELQPFFSQRYGDERRAGHYWFAGRNEAVASMSPGYETKISVVDANFDPMAVQTDTRRSNHQRHPFRQPSRQPATVSV
jgi:type VI protein secretion system component VasA